MAPYLYLIQTTRYSCPGGFRSVLGTSEGWAAPAGTAADLAALAGPVLGWAVVGSSGDAAANGLPGNVGRDAGGQTPLADIVGPPAKLPEALHGVPGAGLVGAGAVGTGRGVGIFIPV